MNQYPGSQIDTQTNRQTDDFSQPWRPDIRWAHCLLFETVLMRCWQGERLSWRKSFPPEQRERESCYASVIVFMTRGLHRRELPVLYFANFAADLQVWKVEWNTTDCAVRSSGTAYQMEFCFLFQSGTKKEWRNRLWHRQKKSVLNIPCSGGFRREKNPCNSLCNLKQNGALGRDSITQPKVHFRTFRWCFFPNETF